VKINFLPVTKTDAPVQPVLEHIVFVSDPSQKEDMQEWVAGHVVGAYAFGYWGYRFELEDDAFRFKLWWG
jgi:hypothetical protein